MEEREPQSMCGNGSTDGEGIILDTFDGSRRATPYDQQIVVSNNITIGNGGRGIEVLKNNTGSSHRHIFIYQNTTWGTNQRAQHCLRRQLCEKSKPPDPIT